MDNDLLDKMKWYLQGDLTFNFIQAETSSNIELYKKMTNKFPVMTKILVSLVQSDGTIEKSVSRLIIAIREAIRKKKAD